MTATGCSGPGRPPLPPIVGTLVAGAVAVVLVRLGRGPLAAPSWHRAASPEAWIEDRAPADAIVAAVRLVALATSLHLVVTGATATVGAIFRRPRLVEAARRCTPPPFRSVLGRLGGLALSAGTLLTVSGPDASAVPPDTHALAGLRQVPPPTGAPSTEVPSIEVPPAPVSSIEGRPTQEASTATLRLRPAPPVGIESGADDANAAASPPPTPPASPATLAPPAGSLHRVVPGDHLWALAEEEVSSRLGRPATDAEVAPYWARVVAANGQLADPDLLFPGDVVTLPPSA